MKHNIKIFAEDSVLVDKKIYFFSRDWNGLYVVNIESKITELIDIMPEEGILSRRLCAGIIYHKGKLILIPMTAKKIWIYDLQTKKWNGLIRENITNEDIHKEIFRGIKYKDYLFLIGSNYPFIIRMNLDTYELTYVSEPYIFLVPLKKDNEGYFRCDFCLIDNQLFIASCLNNYVLCMNLDTLDYKWKKVGENNFCYSGIAWDGENFWLSPRRSTPIVKWDGKDKTKYFPLPEIFKNEQYNFLGVQYGNNQLVFPGMMQKKTLIINIDNQNEFDVIEGQYLFYKYSGEVLLSEANDGLLMVKRKRQNDTYYLYCEMQLEKWISYLKEKSNKEYIREIGHGAEREVSLLSLYSYLVLLKEGRINNNMRTEIGANIWEEIRN